jgi:iron(II)-dependent oxidoreductase
MPLCFEFAALLIVATSAMPVVPGPPSQDAQPAWLAQLNANRSSWRASVNFTTTVYDDFLLFSPSLHIAPQSHIYDRFLYDPVLGAADPAAGWTVGRFLDDLDARYGGIDAVLLWGTYPNLGVDERSQFDLLEDVPGGLPALKDVVAQFIARGVRVGLPFNPWDSGTARRPYGDEIALAQLAATVGADFANGDTMEYMDENFWLASVAAGRPLALQPEGGSALTNLNWTKMCATLRLPAPHHATQISLTTRFPFRLYP